ncbi:MAG TPA: hypothetical protein VGI70_18000, partial [Polyangiales bacterium]
MPTIPPSTDELREAFCLESVDRLSRDRATSAFKATARLHQSQWRAAHGHPIGTHPIRGSSARPLGSRLPLEYAKRTNANFIDVRCADAAAARIAAPQKYQMLQSDRLYADLLSSMPMCFNIFGTVTEPALATRAVKRWWPDVPGRVEQVVFEWSPGRADRAYLGNRTSFDVAFILDLEDGQRGVIGVETKYHEHPVRVGIAPANLARYNDVSRASKLFEAATLELASRETCSQIWLDHLLALSMLQHPTDRWTWARFILVYADGNPSWQPL